MSRGIAAARIRAAVTDGAVGVVHQMLNATLPGQLSPLTEHIRRFGGYTIHELGDEPDAYDPRLDVASPLCAATRQRPRGFHRPREPVSRVGVRQINAPPGRA